MAANCAFLQADFFHDASTAQLFEETTFFSPPDDILISDHLDGCVSGEFINMEGPKTKKLKTSMMPVAEDGSGNISDGQQKVVLSHITVERNRRKQMNHHLTVLRSLMPCFYVKRGDQASIIGGVVDYITELQKVVQTLETKKQQRVYTQVMSPRTISTLSPRKPPLSPRPSLPPISPKTPQPSLPYSSMLSLSPRKSPVSLRYQSTTSLLDPSTPTNSFTSLDSGNELVANSRSAMAEVEVKFMGGNNLLLKTCSNRIPGQATKVIGVLESLSLEVLEANINIVDEALINSFTIKIGVECQLSAEELAHQIQRTFC